MSIIEQSKEIEPLKAEPYSLDDMSLQDAPVRDLIEKVNEIIELLNSWIRMSSGQ